MRCTKPLTHLETLSPPTLDVIKSLCAFTLWPGIAVFLKAAKFSGAVVYAHPTPKIYLFCVQYNAIYLQTDKSPRKQNI